MADFDDLFEQPQEAPPVPEQPFDKEAYAAQKKEQREGLYALADATALDVASDPARFTQYLDVQARFDRYSATNALLVMAQRPAATWLGDLDHWKQQKIFIKRDELSRAVNILAPGSEYRRDNGSVGINMNVKRVYDVSQAERPRLQPISKHDERSLISALAKASPCPVRLVDALDKGEAAHYNEAANEVEVLRGMDGGGDLFRSLALQISYAVLDQADSGSLLCQDKNFAACATAYVLCRKYGVDPPKIPYDVPAYFAGRDSKSIRAELSEINDTIGDVTRQMGKVLEPRKPEARS